MRSARGQDGADGGPDSASSPRNPSWSPYTYRRRPPGTRFPHPAADRHVGADRQLGAEPRSCFPFVKGRAWAGQPDASACSLLTAEMIWAAQGQCAKSRRTGDRRGPAARPVTATADSGPLAAVGDSGQIHAQFCQEGIRRIITVRSALSCKDSPGQARS